MPCKNGLSLLELLMVMAILAILAGAAAPGFQSTLDNREGELALRTLTAQLSLARTSAIEHGSTVTVCPSQDGASCSGNWSDGSIVFTDLNGNQDIDEGDQLIRSSLIGLRGNLRWRAFQNRQYLQIDPTGFMRHQSGNFTYCPADGDARQARQLVVNATGRTRLAVDSNGDGLRENSSGQPLRCDQGTSE